jgi:hypothetical protein
VPIRLVIALLRLFSFLFLHLSYPVRLDHCGFPYVVTFVTAVLFVGWVEPCDKELTAVFRDTATRIAANIVGVVELVPKMLRFRVSATLTNVRLGLVDVLGLALWAKQNHVERFNYLLSGYGGGSNAYLHAVTNCPLFVRRNIFGLTVPFTDCPLYRLVSVHRFSFTSR